MHREILGAETRHGLPQPHRGQREHFHKPKIRCGRASTPVTGGVAHTNHFVRARQDLLPRGSRRSHPAGVNGPAPTHRQRPIQPGRGRRATTVAFAASPASTRLFKTTRERFVAADPPEVSRVRTSPGCFWPTPATPAFGPASTASTVSTASLRSSGLRRLLRILHFQFFILHCRRGGTPPRPCAPAATLRRAGTNRTSSPG